MGEERRPPAPPAWRHPALLAALVALLLYAPSYPFGFVWDDHPLIEQARIHGTGSLAHELTSDFWAATADHPSGYWRPLVTLSYALDNLAWRGRPFGFRLMNGVAHAGASALVTGLALQSGGPAWAALLAGLWFATMPAHVEPVAWISGRTDVYCAVFFLLALVLDRRARRAGRRWPGPWAPLALAAALASKEAALPFVAVAALADGLERRAPWLERLRWLVPYALVTLVYLALHRLWVPPPPIPEVDPVTRAMVPRGVALMFPVQLAFLWPWYPHTPAVTLEVGRAGAARVAASLLVHAAFVAGAGVLAWRRARLALPLLAAWALLLPTYLIDLAAGVLLFPERIVYLPSAAMAWALGLLLAALPRAGGVRWACAGAACLLVGGSAARTLELLPAWRSDATLFESMTRIAPGNYEAHTQFAHTLILQGREAEASREIDAALRLEPLRPDAWTVRASLRSRHGDWEGTLRDATLAIRRGSIQVEPHILEITALLNLGRMDAARKALEALRARAPGNGDVETLWGQYLLATGQPAAAVAGLERGVRLHPEDANLAYMLGLGYAGAGRADAARASFGRAVAADPGFYDAWLQLAELALRAGDAAAAGGAATRAAALPAARDGRAAALMARIRGPR